MPVFLKKLILLIAAGWAGAEIVTRNIAHRPLQALIALVVAVIVEAAIWNWRFE